MAGTQILNEAAPQYVCNVTQTTGPADVMQAMDALDTRNLPNSSTAYCRDFDRWYRYFQFDAGPGIFPSRIKPTSNVGTWVLLAGGGMTGRKCPTVYTVDNFGTGDYPDILSAVAAANLNADGDHPVTVSICPGFYNVGATIVVSNPNVSIVGETQGQVLIQGADTLTALISVTAAALAAGVVRLDNLVLFLTPGNLTTPVVINKTGTAPLLIRSCFLLATATDNVGLVVAAGTADFIESAMQFAAGTTVAFVLNGGSELRAIDSRSEGQALTGNITSGNIFLQHCRFRSLGSGWLLNTTAEGYTEIDCQQEVDLAAGIVLGNAATSLQALVTSSRWNGFIGYQGDTDGASAQLDDVAFTGGFGTTFIRLQAIAPTIASSCRAIGAIPWSLDGTNAVLAVVDGEVDPDLAVYANGATAEQVRWQTSNNVMFKNGLDVGQGSTAFSGRPLAARQLMVRVPFTPCGIDDALGDVGNWAWDDGGVAGAARFFIKIGGAAPGWYVIPLVAMGPCT